jgi:hypothetical protein
MFEGDGRPFSSEVQHKIMAESFAAHVAVIQALLNSFNINHDDYIFALSSVEGRNHDSVMRNAFGSSKAAFEVSFAFHSVLLYCKDSFSH